MMKNFTLNQVCQKTVIQSKIILRSVDWFKFSEKWDPILIFYFSSDIGSRHFIVFLKINELLIKAFKLLALTLNSANLRDLISTADNSFSKYWNLFEINNGLFRYRIHSSSSSARDSRWAFNFIWRSVSDSSNVAYFSATYSFVVNNSFCPE